MNSENTQLNRSAAHPEPLRRIRAAHTGTTVTVYQAYACLSHYDPAVHADRDAWKRQLRESPARVQWDPERDLRLNPLPYRSLQLGLAGEASRRYADEWTVAIRDVTPLAHEIHALVTRGDLAAATALLPEERPYCPAAA
ncbi:DUF4291 family protein [Streptomyces sp. NPDC017529]|uniref:DUF4291 family protein n=1 Tax=Streptomyces sp. NPDC017529 TaxID=3365000 RepID=UPI0037BAAEC6